ncbi:MAG: hypothetical protein AAGG38_15015 [Planctomycetota bacterium]
MHWIIPLVICGGLLAFVVIGCWLDLVRFRRRLREAERCMDTASQLSDPRSSEDD